MSGCHRAVPSGKGSYGGESDIGRTDKKIPDRLSGNAPGCRNELGGISSYGRSAPACVLQTGQ